MSNQELKARLEELFSDFLPAGGQSPADPAPSRNGHDRYRALVENLPIGFYRIASGSPARLLMANKAFLDLLGVERQEVISPGADDDPALPDHSLTWGQVSESEVQLKRKDGTLVRCVVASRAICRPGGEVVYYDCVARESARRKPAELTSTSEVWTRLALDALPEAVLIIKSDRSIASANAAAEKLLGYARAELEHMSVDALYASQRFDVDQALATLAETSTVALTLDVLDKQGQALLIEHQLRLVRDGQGQPVAVLATLHQVERLVAGEAVFTERLVPSVFYPCVYLGSQEDVGTRYGYPTHENYCHAHASPQRLEFDQQADTCIGGDWTACPLYQAAILESQPA